MKLQVRNHLMFWLVYMLWDILQAVIPMSITAESKGFSAEILPGVYTTLTTLPLKILLYYLLFYFIIQPVLFSKTRIKFRIAGSIFCIAALLLVLRTLIFYVVFPFYYKVDMSAAKFFNLSSLIIILFDLIMPACLLTIYELYRYSKNLQLKESRLEKEKLSSELGFLKSQINPHFLFNVLSTVHALSRNKAPEAAAVTMKLSQIMRFMLFGARQKTIPVRDEIKILEDYIDLEKARFSQKLTVQFEKFIDEDARQIAPLILLPFVENAFKHGSGESRFPSFVHISLRIEKCILHFTIENSIEENGHNAQGAQIGLANIRRQLQLIYPEHELQLEKKEQTFFVSLVINLQSVKETQWHQ